MVGKRLKWLILFLALTAITFNHLALAGESGAVKTQGQSSNVYAPQASDEEFETVTAKLVTWDAPPNEPGKIEIDSSYSFLGSGKAWSTDGNRHSRNLLRQHIFDESVYVGVVKNLDVFIAEGFSIQADKDNNVNEAEGLFDPSTGEELEDGTEGPAHGHGLKDMLVGARWQFYNNEARQLSLSYVPVLQIPIGRRSNLDHLGPSQGYVSMDNRLVLTKIMGRWNVNVNAAYNAPFANLKRTDDSCGILNGSVAVGYQVKRWLHPELEVIYNHTFDKHEKGHKLVTLVFGFIVPINKRVRLDLGMFQDALGSDSVQSTTGFFRVVLFS